MDRLYAGAHRFRYSTLALPVMINQRVRIDITFCVRHRHESWLVGVCNLHARSVKFEMERIAVLNRINVSVDLVPASPIL